MGRGKEFVLGMRSLINPSLLFLDEPKSGLYSTTSLRTAQKLQDITEVWHPNLKLFYYSLAFVERTSNNFEQNTDNVVSKANHDRKEVVAEL